MKFPFSITNTIVLDQKDFGISSEKYILNYIEDHMSQYSMALKKYSENELFYYKIDPLNLYRKKDLIRNISIKVECSEKTITVTLKTETILVFFLALLAFIIPFTLGQYHIELQVMLIGMLIVLPYSIKAITLRSFKNDIESLLEELRK